MRLAFQSQNKILKVSGATHTEQKHSQRKKLCSVRF